MSFFKVAFGVLIVLASSRLVPHTPNFTSLQTLSFYIPALLGMRFLPITVICLAITDLVIGFHSLVFFTWGSVIIIGLTSKYLKKNFTYRIVGAFSAAILFYIITNFGVWISGSYSYTFEGLILCYTLAIPFFYNSLISTLILSSIIEVIYRYFFFSKKISDYKTFDKI